MKRLTTFFIAVLLSYASAFAIVDNSNDKWTIPVQKYKHKPYALQKDGFFVPRHTDSKYFKPLGVAIREGKHKEVQRLLDSGVSPNQLQETMSPLGIAVQGDNIEAFMILMNHKDIDVNQYYTVIERGGAVASTRLTAIADAIYLGNPTMMRMLLDKGAKVDYIFETINLSAKPPTMDARNTPLTFGFAHIGYYVLGSKYPTSKFNVHEQFVELQRIADMTTNLNRKFIIHSHHAGPGNVPHKTDVPFTSSPNSLLMQIISGNHYASDGNPFRKEINDIIISLIERGADADYEYYADVKNMVKVMQYTEANFGGTHIKSSIEVVKANAKCSTSVKPRVSIRQL